MYLWNVLFNILSAVCMYLSWFAGCYLVETYSYAIGFWTNLKRNSCRTVSSCFKMSIHGAVKSPSEHGSGL